MTYQNILIIDKSKDVWPFVEMLELGFSGLTILKLCNYLTVQP